MNPIRYIQIAVVVGVIALAFTSKLLWDSNQELKARNSVLSDQLRINERNVQLLNVLLEREREIKEAAFIAITELRKEVPDEVYSQELPPELQGVIDRFNRRIRP